ncbi:MAG: kinesin-like protein Klp5 [Chaenotheca gracillima]|nr:MAG: kinesin-like protein Klp5 [Chaenotheca gracillima]
MGDSEGASRAVGQANFSELSEESSSSSKVPSALRASRKKDLDDEDNVPASSSSSVSSLSEQSISRASASRPDQGSGSKSPQKRWRRWFLSIRWFLLDQWFLITLGILVAISSQVQVPASRQAEREVVVTYLCVALIFTITGCTLPTAVLIDNYKKWKVHLFVQAQSFLMTSAIIFAVVSLCATNPNFMDPGLLVGMIFTGCVPTTISSNVIMTGQAHGNQALTVVQSTLGNFLGPFISPLLIEMYLSTGAWYTDVVPRPGAAGFGELYRRVFKQLGLSIFVPLVAGQIAQNLFPGLTKKVFTDWKLRKLGSFALLIIIWQSFDQAFATGAFTSVKGDNMIFIVFISVAFYFIWTTVCIASSLPWLDRKDIIAIAYCVPAKTPAMGVPLASVMFAGLSPVTESKLQIPLIIFQGFQIAAGSLLTLAFRKWIGNVGDLEKSGES